MWGFYFVLIYRCGPGALLLLMVLVASLWAWKYLICVCVRVCAHHCVCLVCLWLCAFSLPGKNRKFMHITAGARVCNWFPLLDLFLKHSQNSVHNYDRVMLFFCGGLKLAPITMATFGTVSLGLVRGKQRCREALSPQMVVGCLSLLCLT